MDDLPINRASNPFKNQGYLLRLARQRIQGMPGRRRHRARKSQRGGALNAYIAMKSGQKTGRKLDGWFKRNKKNLLDGLKSNEEEEWENFQPLRRRYLQL